MARQEHDKEDLIADATVLVDRAEFRLASVTERGVCLVTAGFRENGQLSVYFDQDPFYQFDEDGRLRRALEDGFLFRSQTVTLARMHREREGTRTMLVRHDLTADEVLAFRTRMREKLRDFAAALAADKLQRLRRVVVSDDFESLLRGRLQAISQLGDDFLSSQINQR